jgi:hypothetical protein
MTVLHPSASAMEFAANMTACECVRRLLHHTHHKYNKEHTLSPFAGLAFNALDGILQARTACHCIKLQCKEVWGWWVLGWEASKVLPSSSSLPMVALEDMLGDGESMLGMASRG